MPYGTLNGQINIGTLTSQTTITTSSTGLVSTGLGLTIGSNYTGRYLILASSTGFNTTLNDGVVLAVFRLPGGAVPALAASTTGTQVPGSISIVSPTASAFEQMILNAIDAPGIGSWTYYLAFAALTGGTAQIPSRTADIISLTVIEL